MFVVAHLEAGLAFTAEVSIWGTSESDNIIFVKINVIHAATILSA